VAQAYFQNWLREAACARRNGPGDPDQVKVTDVIQDYVTAHGPNVAASGTLAIVARSLMFFFRDDTLASLAPHASINIAIGAAPIRSRSSTRTLVRSRLSSAG
jgi:uncharacterized membrane protein YdfJ with MMPL/SSD domain